MTDKLTPFQQSLMEAAYKWQSQSRCNMVHMMDENMKDSEAECDDLVEEAKDAFRALVERAVDIDSIATVGGFMSVTSKRMVKKNDK